MEIRLVPATSALLFLLAGTPALAGPQARASGGERTTQQMMNDVPHCARKLGTVSIADGDDPNGWTQYGLGSPQALLKVIVQRSGCFNLVDRGTGLSAAQQERNIGGSLGLQRGSNVGLGQIKAADYVLVAEIQDANDNTSGSSAGAGIGGLINHRLGSVIGGVSSRKMEANTVLSLTNVRTTETIETEEGYAAKNNLSFSSSGGLGFLGGGLSAVGGGYDNTDIGRVVTLSFIQAYSKMVNDLGLVTPGDAGTAQFDVTTNIGTPVPGQAPSGNCIFSVPASSNGANVSLPVIGSVYQPSLAIISPTLPINHPGSTTITTKVSPSFGGVQIDQSCSVCGGTTITPMTANKLTSSSGQAAFTINVQNLAVVNPNTSVTPTASCTFTVHSGTGTAIASFSTGNACAYGLQPAPPGCGNP